MFFSFNLHTFESICNENRKCEKVNNNNKKKKKHYIKNGYNVRQSLGLY